MSKILVDEFGDPVRIGDAYMSRDGSYWEVFALEVYDHTGGDIYPVGACREGMDPEDDGDWFTARSFGFQWKEPVGS